jgi:hypothetical protein
MLFIFGLISLPDYGIPCSEDGHHLRIHFASVLIIFGVELNFSPDIIRVINQEE